LEYSIAVSADGRRLFLGVKQAGCAAMRLEVEDDDAGLAILARDVEPCGQRLHEVALCGG
jgi:hypothetical protein